MPAEITVQMLPQGLLIPKEDLGDWGTKKLEAVRDEQKIVIRLKPASADTRDPVRQMLRAAGMLYEPDWETPPPVSSEARAHLAKKLAQGQPLSEIIIADRQDHA